MTDRTTADRQTSRFESSTVTMGTTTKEKAIMKTNAVIHRGDPRFDRPITVDSKQVGHLKPSVDRYGTRLCYEVQLLDGSGACFDTLAQARTWVERSTSTTLSIVDTVKVGANALEPGMVICYNGKRHEAIVKVLDDFFYLTSLDTTPEGIEFIRNRPESKHAEYLNTQRGEEYDIDASTIPSPEPTLVTVTGPLGENPVTVAIIHDGEQVYIVTPMDENGCTESIGSCSRDHYKLEDRGLWQFSPADRQRYYAAFSARTETPWAGEDLVKA